MLRTDEGGVVKTSVIEACGRGDIAVLLDADGPNRLLRCGGVFLLRGRRLDKIAQMPGTRIWELSVRLDTGRDQEGVRTLAYVDGSRDFSWRVIERMVESDGDILGRGRAAGGKHQGRVIHGEILRIRGKKQTHYNFGSEDTAEGIQQVERGYLRAVRAEGSW